MIILTVNKVIDLHKLVSDVTGGDPGLRDRGLLDSAVSSAFQTFDGTELYPSVEEKAARLGYALISNHAFIDGNKRIGMLIMLTFLEINGVHINPTNDEVARIGISAAAGTTTFPALLQWINDNK